MEIRSATICYSKNKFKCIRNREQVLIRKLDQLDGTIFNNFSSPDIDDVLREYDELKTELQSIYEEKGKQAKNVITRKRLLVKFDFKMTQQRMMEM